MKKRIWILVVAAVLCAAIAVGLGVGLTSGKGYKVVFETNGGNAIETIKVKEGESLDLPIPTREGCEFQGWYLDPELTGDRVADSYAPSGDVTLYAKWRELARYTVVFKNGDQVLSTETVYEGYSATPPANPVKESTAQWEYRFLRWDAAFDRVTGDLTVNAVFEAILRSYDVTFLCEGAVYDAQKVDYGETVAEPTTPTKERTDLMFYTFSGWYTDPEFTDPYNFSTVVTGAVTLYAKMDEDMILTFTEEADGSGYSVTRLNDRKALSVSIPAAYNGKPVTSIGEEAFKDTGNPSLMLERVIIPDGVTRIEKNAFFAAQFLSDIAIPGGVTSIGDNAFYGCGSLVSMIIPVSVTEIGQNCFGFCGALTIYAEASSKPTGWTDASIESEVSVVWDFHNNESAHDGKIYVVQSGLKYMVDTAAGSATVAKQPLSLSGAVVIPSFITYKDVEYPVTAVEERAFYRNTRITEVTIGDEVTEIKPYAFGDCSGIRSLTIGNKVSVLRQRAFSGCHALADLIIPASVQTIEGAVFSGVTMLYAEIAEAQAPSGWIRNWNIGKPVVWDCQNNQIASDGNRYIMTDGIRYVLKNDGAFSVASGYQPAVGALVFPSEIEFEQNRYAVTEIPADAFFLKAMLTSVTISAGIENIGDNAFDGCSILTNVTFAGDVINIGYEAFYRCFSLQSVAIPAGAVIGSNAFSSTGLESVFLEDGLTSIGDKAFDGCKKLTSVTIPSTVSNLGERVFNDCTALQSVILKEGLTSIGRYAFYRTSLTDLIIPSTVTTIGENAFSSCQNLKNVVLPEGLMTIERYAFEYCYALTDIVIPTTVTSIGAYAFGSCAGIVIQTEATAKPAGWDAYWNHGYPVVWDYKNNAVAEDGYRYVYVNGIHYGLKDDGTAKFAGQLRSIGEDVEFSTTVTYEGVEYVMTNFDFSVFANSHMKNVKIIGIPEIGNRAFYGHASLENVVLDGVTSIGEYAFSKCGNLKSFTILNSNGLTSIGKYAFDGCGNLNNFTIPDGVTSIDVHAFSECGNLKSLTIPNSVTTIGAWAVYRCGNLTDLTFLGTKAEWDAITKGDAWDAESRNYTLHCTDGDFNWKGESI